MPYYSLFKLILHIILLIKLAESQECITPCLLPINTCSIVDYPVYPVGLNVTQTESQAKSIISGLELYGKYISKECQAAVRTYTCGVLYPRCDNSSSLDVLSTVSLKPCLDMCLKVHEYCSAYLTYLSAEQLAFINCNQTLEDGSPLFSTDSDCYTLENLDPVVRCTNESFPSGNVTDGGCTTFNTSALPLTGEACAPFVSSEIYLNSLSIPNLLSILDATANASAVFLLKKIYPVLQIGCYKQMMSLICQTTYPACERVADGNGVVVEIPRSPCQDSCLKARSECTLAIEILGQSFLNCSAVNPLTGLTLWPDKPTPFVAGTHSISGSCSVGVVPDKASAKFVLPNVEKCPSILVKVPNPSDEDSVCWVACPDVGYTPEMWSGLVTIGLVGASLSLFLMVFLIASYIIIPEYRTRWIHLCIFFSCILLSISFFINGRHPEESVWCNDQARYATGGTNAACAVQGFLFQFSVLCLATWWTIVSYHMFSHIVINKLQKPRLDASQKHYHIFSWGIPIIYSVVTAGLGGYKYGTPIPWCFVHTPRNTSRSITHKPGLDLDWIVFYMPLGVLLLASTLMTACVLYKVAGILRESGEVRGRTSKDVSIQRRLMFFVILLLVVFVLIFEWRIKVEFGDTRARNVKFLLCSLENDLGYKAPSDCLGSYSSVDYNHTALQTFLPSFFGLFVFLAFGTDKMIFRTWAIMLKIRKKTGSSDLFLTHSDGGTQMPVFSTTSVDEKLGISTDSP